MWTTTAIVYLYTRTTVFCSKLVAVVVVVVAVVVVVVVVVAIVVVVVVVVVVLSLSLSSLLSFVSTSHKYVLNVRTVYI